MLPLPAAGTDRVSVTGAVGMGAGVDAAPQKPAKLEEMIALARKLSRGFPMVRVDFYVDGDRLYVGEMTFSPGMFLKIEPTEEDRRMGDLIHLEDIDSSDIE